MTAGDGEDERGRNRDCARPFGHRAAPLLAGFTGKRRGRHDEQAVVVDQPGDLAVEGVQLRCAPLGCPHGANSEPDFSATDRTSDSAENPQDDADYDEDAADGVQDGYTGEVTDQQQDDAEHDHVLNPIQA
jgi:hypothetical protein